jgi:RNA polymerase sigma-70 factor (ECF subfamily)
MDDRAIIELYNKRDENAIGETQRKYGRYCHTIAYNILRSDEDSEECVNDTYLKVWNSIPPKAPQRFCAFIGKITRNTALDRYAQRSAQKRDAGVELALDELSECISSEMTGDVSDEIALKTAINGFLASLPRRTRIIFMRRYFYLLSVKEIAEGLSMSESNVKVTLMRTREKFREHLENEGIVI